MTDKWRPKKHKPKGEAYCNIPFKSCCYDDRDVCINCGRPKGWRRYAAKQNPVPEPLGDASTISIPG